MDKVKILNQTVEGVLNHLTHTADLNIELDSDSQYYQIQIQTDNPGMLIGYRGDNLSALQLLIGLLINSQLEDQEDRVKVLVNVNDYRERRNATLQQLALNAAQKVKYSGEAYYFDNLTPAERRTVHMALKEDPDLETYSEGEGKFRRLVVALKT